MISMAMVVTGRHQESPVIPVSNLHCENSCHGYQIDCVSAKFAHKKRTRDGGIYSQGDVLDLGFSHCTFSK